VKNGVRDGDDLVELTVEIEHDCRGLGASDDTNAGVDRIDM